MMGNEVIANVPAAEDPTPSGEARRFSSLEPIGAVAFYVRILGVFSPYSTRPVVVRILFGRPAAKKASMSVTAAGRSDSPLTGGIKGTTLMSASAESSTTASTKAIQRPSEETSDRPERQSVEVTPHLIRDRAYEIYTQRAASARRGDEISDWLEAKRELTGRRPTGDAAAAENAARGEALMGGDQE
jgi:hypothetical protein